MANNIEETQISATPSAHRYRKKHIAAFSITAFVILAIGAAGGATAMRLTRPSVEMAPMAAVAISDLKDDWNPVTIKGKVAELFGNKFVVQDDSGRALVEVGPAGAGGKIVALNEPVTVQGHFENGFLHASFVVRQDGEVVSLGPPAPPPPHGGPLEVTLRHLHL